MHYKLHSLDHAPLVKSADKIMEAFLNDFYYDVSTNENGTVFYHISRKLGNNDQVDINPLLKKFKYTDKGKFTITIDMANGISICLHGINKQKDITIYIKNHMDHPKTFLNIQ